MTLNTGAHTTARTVDVAEVRRRHPLEEVVAASGVQLHRTGRGWMGSCPFHQDATASLPVAGVPDRFHCFGCGASGDVIDYIGRLHGVAFRDAVALLDNTAPGRMPLSAPPPARTVRHRVDPRRETEVDQSRGYEINSLAGQWFQRPVAHTFAVSYLRHHRGIDLADAETELGQTLVGHTGHGWTPLVDHLRSRGVTDDELVAMDLAQPTRQGRLVDTLRDRLIIPVTDPDGRITGFVGRDTSSHPRAPKYRNPTRTVTFDKSHCLYRPTHTTVPAATVIVVEGALDALAITAATSRSGLLEQLAPCSTLGTAVTPAQAERVAGLTSAPVVLALDGDQAGADGTLRWVDALCRQAGRLALVTRLPDGLDPADWLARHGPDGLVAFHPARRHTTTGGTEGGELRATRPHLPGRELAALACADREPVRTLIGDLQRLAPLLNRGALDDLACGAIAEMTRQGGNPDAAFARDLTRALTRGSRPPPRGLDNTAPSPPHLPDLR